MEIKAYALFLQGIVKTIRSYICELSLCLIAFVTNIILFNQVPELPGHIALSTFFSISIVYSMNKLCHGMKRWIYYISPLVWTAFISSDYIQFAEPQAVQMLISIGIGIAMFIVVANKKKESDFAQYLIIFIFTAATAFLMSLIFFLLFSVVDYSTRFALEINHFGEKDLLYISMFSGYIVFPMLFAYLLHVRKKWELRNEDILLNLLSNYIIAPGIFLFTVTFFLYAIRIIWTNQLPHGEIAILGIAYLTSMFVGELLSHFSRSRFWAWFFHTITFWTLPALILLWIATIVRLQYGFTEARGYLVLVDLWFTLIFISRILPRMRLGYQTILIIMLISLATTTYIPFINFHNIDTEIKERKASKIIPIRNNKTSKNVPFASKTAF
ncbi:MAG: hypothetical protein WCR36_01475 [Bacteroidaceae bacterium]